MILYTNQPCTATLDGHLTVATLQILGFSACQVQPTSVVWLEVSTILQVTHSATTCVLAMVQFVRQLLQMYRVTKQWQPNRYMNLLVNQGIMYFSVYVLV